MCVEHKIYSNILLILSKKQSSLTELAEWVSLLGSALLLLSFSFSGFPQGPLTFIVTVGGWVGGWMGGCGYIPLKNFRFENLSFENILLFRSLEVLGGTLFNFFWCQKVNFRARRSKMDPKIDTFGHIDTRVLAILGVKKNRFLDFVKVVLELFRKCLSTVFGFKRPTFGFILSQKGS